MTNRITKSADGDNLSILVVGMTNRLGGTEQFFYNFYQHMKDAFTFSFINSYDKIYHQAIYEHDNCKVYRIANLKKAPLHYYHDFKNILISSKIDAIYFNMLSFANVLPIIAARKTGTKIILHAHSTNTNGIIKKILHTINKHLFLRKTQLNISCSNEAGKWMFGKQDYYVVQNTIDGDKFAYNKQERISVRKKYGIGENEILIGHVGRFSKEKNHKYLIDVLCELQSKNKNYKLMLVGDGKTKDNTKKYAIQKKIDQKVIFTGQTYSPSRFYQAMDIFLMPSLYEGLSLTALEAQASGLPCVFTENMDRDVDISGRSKFLPITKKSVSKWAEACRSMQGLKRDANSTSLESSAKQIKELIEEHLC